MKRAIVVATALVLTFEVNAIEFRMGLGNPLGFPLVNRFDKLWNSMLRAPDKQENPFSSRIPTRSGNQYVSTQPEPQFNGDFEGRQPNSNRPVPVGPLVDRVFHYLNGSNIVKSFNKLREKVEAETRFLVRMFASLGQQPTHLGGRLAGSGKTVLTDSRPDATGMGTDVFGELAWSSGTTNPQRTEDPKGIVASIPDATSTASDSTSMFSNELLKKINPTRTINIDEMVSEDNRSYEMPPVNAPVSEASAKESPKDTKSAKDEKNLIESVKPTTAIETLTPKDAKTLTKLIDILQEQSQSKTTLSGRDVEVKKDDKEVVEDNNDDNHSSTAVPEPEHSIYPTSRGEQLQKLAESKLFDESTVADSYVMQKDNVEPVSGLELPAEKITSSDDSIVMPVAAEDTYELLKLPNEGNVEMIPEGNFKSMDDHVPYDVPRNQNFPEMFIFKKHRKEVE